MSTGGLLGNMLGGALKEGANEAVNQNKMAREGEAKDINYARQTALASLQAHNSRQNSMYEADRRAEEGDKDRASRERIARLSKDSGSRPVQAWEPITQKDLEGNITVVGKFNKVTGDREMFGPDTPEAQPFDIEAFKASYKNNQGGEGDSNEGGKPSSDYRERLSGDMANSEQQASDKQRLSKQQDVYNTWLSNIGAKLGGLKGVTPAGLLQSPQKASPSQNELDQYLSMLNDVAAKGTPEQKAEAERLFQQLTR